MLFYAAAYSSDSWHETVYTGKEKSVQITFLKQPIVDGNLLKAEVRTEQKEKLQLQYKISTEEEKK